MQRFMVTFLSVMASFLGQAQNKTTADPLAAIATVPAFKVFTVPDSSSYSNADLIEGKPLVIVFFSPDCEHCQKETKELLAYKSELKDIPILMVSPASYEAIKTFYSAYGLNTMPNLHLGNDANYALGSRFQLRTYPSLFIYDVQGKLAKAFVGNIGVPDILASLK